MDFSLSKAQRELQERAREAVETLVRPMAAAVPKGAKLSNADMRRLYQGLAPLGYVGSTIPREAGGAGLSLVDYGLLLEALAEGPVVLGEVVPPRTVHFLGNAEQKRRWLRKLLAGEWISTACITEPQAGSDLRNLQTTAVRDGDNFRVNGAKKWIKLGGVADLITLLVVADPAKGAKGGTSRLILERAQSPWVAREIDSLGISNLSFAELGFKDVRVPVENLVGEAGGGTEAFHRAMEGSRALIGIQALGIARRALDIAKAYAKSRRAFGRNLAQMQLIQAGIADASAEVEAARLLCLRALWLLDSGQRCPGEAAMAKLLGSEVAVKACNAAMETMGAAGFAVENDVERCLRDARMLTVIDGASGIQRLIAGRELLGVAAFT